MVSDPVEKFIVRPDGRIIPQEPVSTLQYDTRNEERCTISVAGEQLPCYVVKRRSKLRGAWGHKFQVYSTNRGQEVACINFHSILPRIEIDLVRGNRKVRIKTYNSVRQYDASGGLGRVYWKGMSILSRGKASWNLRNTNGLVLLVTADDIRGGGIISLCKKGLDEGAIEELVLIGIAQIEEYNRLSRGYIRTAAVAS
ncbi:hypothetical protein BKA59DRAFT_497729 [Fusarium tricinctum]|jgi:hypothetical protein|uniref:Uncharacterized protein n=2 Tax=Fusarium tricinctum species complex TaxID=679429 RepID=A0A8K0RL06_9HYPO|nr:hypothetical protein BKA59DRAFT_497729 [Fusarium tricinctum]